MSLPQGEFRDSYNAVMRIVISGANGFLGSWIAAVLSTDHEVTALVRESSDLRNLSHLPSVQIVRLNPPSWERFISEIRPNVLIVNHWEGVGNKDRDSPKQFNNLELIHKFVSAAVKAGTETLIGVGSQAELGPISSHISESAPDNPLTNYAKAKVKARSLIQKSISDADFRFVWMRIFSTYGPLDEGSWLIPNIVDSLLLNEVARLTKGEQEWSYLHAYDLANAFSTVLKNPEISGIVNVGNPQTITIREVALKIGHILCKPELLDFGALDYRSDQVMSLRPRCESLTRFGWYPQISFDCGLKQTIDWLEGKKLQPLITTGGYSLDFKLPSRR